jgi:hypothetical protein
MEFRILESMMTHQDPSRELEQGQDLVSIGIREIEEVVEHRSHVSLERCMRALQKFKKLPRGPRTRVDALILFGCMKRAATA